MNGVQKVFEKHETLICIGLIVLYIVINSFCIQNFGITDYRSVVVNTVFSAMLLYFVVKLDRVAYYGLTRVRNAKAYLYFLPLVLVVSVNLWSGIHINHTGTEILFHILTMFNIGFLEELIFRGFLFKMMAKDNVRLAIVVSAVTFGIGHIVNLFNGADLIPTLLQICYAISIGYLFVIIFYKSGSIIPCIIAHALFNACSIFNIETAVSLYIAPVVLVIVPIVYAVYIDKTVINQ